MFSKIPVDLKKIKKSELNKEIVRLGIVAEIDAINLYEQLAAAATDPDIKKVFLDIANEEKTHFGEFNHLLLKTDNHQIKENEKAQKEIKDLLG